MKNLNISDDNQYNLALNRIEELLSLSLKPNTRLGKELERLLQVVESYEEKYYPIDVPSEEEMIRFREEQQKEV